MSNVPEVTDADFETQVLQSDQPVLVDFWAPWCGPCRAIAPMIEELAGENADSLKVVKVNVDDSQATATRFSISTIPTLMIFKGGEVVERLGPQSKDRMQQAIDEATA